MSLVASPPSSRSRSAMRGRDAVESLLRDLAGSGFSGPVSLEIEYDGNWPDWETCAADVKRAKAYWDGVAARI